MSNPTALFLDDERFPPNDGRQWHTVRTVAQAVRWIKAHGAPAYISFDNDLQRRLEGRHFAQWLVRCDVEREGDFLPADFAFYVHSQNSVNGIQGLLEPYLTQRETLKQRLAGRPRAW